MQLSPNFTLQELTFSQTATRRGINNQASNQIIYNLRILCKEILQPVRDRFGAIKITSGYRSQALNIAIGGSTKSDHQFGYAADIVPLQASKKDVAKWISVNCDFHQIIMEFGTSPSNPSWIHVSCNPKSSKKILWAHGRPVTYTAIAL